MTQIETGYLDSAYLSTDYLLGVAQTHACAQFKATIDYQSAIAFQLKSFIESDTSAAMQFLATINATKDIALQFLAALENKSAALPVQFVADLVNYGYIGNSFYANVFANDFIAMQFKAYVDNFIQGAPFQFKANVDALKGMPLQFKASVIDYPQAVGLQLTAITSGIEAGALQFKATVIEDSSIPLQFKSFVNDYPQGMASQFLTSKHIHQIKGYLVDEYLVGSYFVDGYNVILPLQFNAIVEAPNSVPTQFKATINDERAVALQFNGEVDDFLAVPLQFRGVIDYEKSIPLQFHATIEDTTAIGTQFKAIVDELQSIPIQFIGVRGQALPIQFRSALYNTTNLRILCDFPSRGLAPNNWTANTTATGDFSVNNINTDIVEQVWRGSNGVLTGVKLVCDTGLAQGVYLDTLAILNHNFTTSATLLLEGSSDPLFGSSGFSTTIPITNTNMYYIAPELPNNGYRYWRITIDDATNTNGYLQVGTIVFGSAIILQGECFSNPVTMKKQHFSDTINTEGFTNVANDRGIKKLIGLTFESINGNGGNYSALSGVFDYAKTNLKCLWIPTPAYPTRFAVFGKLTELPSETHIDNGQTANYVNLDLEIDEAK